MTVLWSIAQNKCATEMRYTALRGLLCAVSLLAVHNDNSPAESTLQVMVIGVKMNNNCSVHAFPLCLRQLPPHTKCCRLLDEKLKKTSRVVVKMFPGWLKTSDGSGWVYTSKLFKKPQKYNVRRSLQPGIPRITINIFMNKRLKHPTHIETFYGLKKNKFS